MLPPFHPYSSHPPKFQLGLTKFTLPLDMQLSLLGVSAFALMGATPVIAVPTKANSFTVDVVPSFYISTLAPCEYYY